MDAISIANEANSKFDTLHQSIQDLDLRRIIWKMADPDEGKGFTPQMLARAELDYRRFLHLHVLFPEVDLVPTEMIDEVWHQHILDTNAYAADCEKIFGHFLHHYPYFGMEGEEDQVKDFLAWAQQGPSTARVDKAETRWRSYTGEFPDFRLT